MPLGTCYKLTEVEEGPARVSDSFEHLGIVYSDIIHICHKKDSSQAFCLVVTGVIQGAIRSVCHEFERVNFKFIFLKTLRELTEVIVFRDGGIRWNLLFTAETDDTLKDLYQTFVVDENLTVIITIDSTYDFFIPMRFNQVFLDYITDAR